MTTNEIIAVLSMCSAVYFIADYVAALKAMKAYKKEYESIQKKYVELLMTNCEMALRTAIEMEDYKTAAFISQKIEKLKYFSYDKKGVE